MSRFKKRIAGFLIAFMMLLSVISLDVVNASPTTLETEDVTTFLDGVIRREINSHRIPNLSVAVVHEGKVLFANGYGFADQTTQTPVDPEQTLFRIGSTSKLFTWTAVMQLVAQGRNKAHHPPASHGAHPRF